MTNKTAIKGNTRHSVFFTGALVLLTLLASCTVRKSINLLLDVPVSKSVNASKPLGRTIVSCTVYETEIVSKHTVYSNSVPAFPLHLPKDSEGPAVLSGASYLFSFFKAPPRKPTPLFILYKKLKILG